MGLAGVGVRWGPVLREQVSGGWCGKCNGPSGHGLISTGNPSRLPRRGWYVIVSFIWESSSVKLWVHLKILHTALGRIFQEAPIPVESKHKKMPDPENWNLLSQLTRALTEKYWWLDRFVRGKWEVWGGKGAVSATDTVGWKLGHNIYPQPSSRRVWYDW